MSSSLSSHFHFHTFTFTLSLSHFYFQTLTFTLSLSHFHFHNFTFTISLSHFHFQKRHVPPRGTPGEQQPVLEAAWKSGKWNTTNLSKCDLPHIVLNVMNSLEIKKFWTLKKLSFLYFTFANDLKIIFQVDRAPWTPGRKVEAKKSSSLEVKLFCAISLLSFFVQFPIIFFCNFTIAWFFNLSLLLHRPSTLDKFAETGWRWLFYFLAHVLRFSFNNCSNFFFV